jgi:hypothetical protein
MELDHAVQLIAETDTHERLDRAARLLELSDLPRDETITFSGLRTAVLVARRAAA